MYGRSIIVVPRSKGELRGRSKNAVATRRQHSESVEQRFSSQPHSHLVHEVPTTTCLRCHYVNAVLTTPLLRFYCVLIRPRPHYVFLNIYEEQPRPSCQLRPYYALIGFCYAPITSYEFVLRTSICSRT